MLIERKREMTFKKTSGAQLEVCSELLDVEMADERPQGAAYAYLDGGKLIDRLRNSIVYFLLVCVFLISRNSYADGTIWAVEDNGDLKYYGYISDADFVHTPTRRYGSGWDQFSSVFAGGNGEIFAIEDNGDLKHYQHDRDLNFTIKGRKVGTGWDQFSNVFAGGNGEIFAIADNGDLKYYQHDRDLNFTIKGRKVGTGWDRFDFVTASFGGLLATAIPDCTISEISGRANVIPIIKNQGTAGAIVQEVSCSAGRGHTVNTETFTLEVDASRRVLMRSTPPQNNVRCAVKCVDLNNQPEVVETNYSLSRRF